MNSILKTFKVRDTHFVSHNVIKLEKMKHTLYGICERASEREMENVANGANVIKFN